MNTTGSLYRLVHDVGSYKHIIQIHSQRLTQASDTHNCTICLGLILVSGIDWTVIDVSLPEEIHTCT